MESLSKAMQLPFSITCGQSAVVCNCTPDTGFCCNIYTSYVKYHPVARRRGAGRQGGHGRRQERQACVQLCTSKQASTVARGGVALRGAARQSACSGSRGGAELGSRVGATEGAGAGHPAKSGTSAAGRGRTPCSQPAHARPGTPRTSTPRRESEPQPRAHEHRHTAQHRAR